MEHMENFLARFVGERHNHLWGYEVWIENNELYCNKLLILNKGFTSSWHYHERKDETFIILQGEVELTYKDGVNEAVTVLQAGDKFRIKPGVIHKFKSIDDRSIIMEVSLTDDDDNVKLESARELREDE